MKFNWSTAKKIKEIFLKVLKARNIIIGTASISPRQKLFLNTACVYIIYLLLSALT